LQDCKLPEEAINQIRQYVDDGDRAQFAMGDLIGSLVAEMYPTYPKCVIRSRIAIEGGIAPETVRDRERISQLVNIGLRESYPLTYHQWRACCSCADKSQIETYAKWAVESSDDFGGRVASVLAIRAYIKGIHEDIPTWRRRFDKSLELLEMVRDDRDADEKVRKFCVGVIVVATGEGLAV
jgi:hypothetical protein